MILHNGKIWTGHTVPSPRVRGEGQGEGRPSSGLRPPSPRTRGEGTETIDLRGRLAIPGFIDNHVHFIEGGLQLARVQLRDADSPEEFARRIAVHARKLGAGKWITGGSWDEQRWPGAPLPARQMIDALTPDNPVFVSRLDIHMALASSLALQRAGITRETPDPPGGTIVRDASGEPTGLLKDAAMKAVLDVIPPPSLDERVDAARAALREAARFGVTSFCDMSIRHAEDDLAAYDRLEREGALTARVSFYAPIGVPVRHPRVAGVKGFADGSLGSSTAWFFDSYEDEPQCGLAMRELSSGDMERWIAEAVANDLQVAIHAIGDRANHEVLSIYESLPRAARLRIEHAQHLDPDLIARIARGRIIASMQPYHAIDDGRWAEKKIGHERAKFAYAFRSLLDAGAIVAFGSDWPVAPLDPILGIHAAVTRRTLDGHTWIPEQRITVEEALRAYTLNNGSDFVVLSHDLFTIAPEEIENVRVDMTIFDGKIIYERN